VAVRFRVGIGVLVGVGVSEGVSVTDAVGVSVGVGATVWQARLARNKEMSKRLNLRRVTGPPFGWRDYRLELTGRKGGGGTVFKQIKR
jgi:hypothetical protein